MHRSVRIVKRAIDVIGSSIGSGRHAAALSGDRGRHLPRFAGADLHSASAAPGELKSPTTSPTGCPGIGNGARTPAVHEFEMLKFRTMRADAEKLHGPVLATEDDPRITRVGRFLRKTRLDELPQFLNVLRGEMSLVGPRPERPELRRASGAWRSPTSRSGCATSSRASPGSRRSRSATPASRTRTARSRKFEADLTNPFRSRGPRTRSPTTCASSCSTTSRTAPPPRTCGTSCRVELGIIFKTPLVMLRALGT